MFLFVRTLPTGEVVRRRLDACDIEVNKFHCGVPAEKAFRNLTREEIEFVKIGFEQGGSNDRKD